MTKRDLRSLDMHWLAVSDCRWERPWPDAAAASFEHIMMSLPNRCPTITPLASPARDTRSALAQQTTPAERDPLSP